jgi:hypothetical protein
LQHLHVAIDELGHGATAMLGHDENVEALEMHPICQLGKDVSMAAGASRYQHVRSVGGVAEVDQLLSFGAAVQTRMLERQRDSAGSVEVT